MRISDWSSDVCSSDLGGAQDVGIQAGRYDVLKVHASGKVDLADGRRRIRFDPQKLSPAEQRDRHQLSEKKPLDIHEGDRRRWTTNDQGRGRIGRASCRERVRQHESNSAGPEYYTTNVTAGARWTERGNPEDRRR